jgi:two-component system cell cycle response regulator
MRATHMQIHTLRREEQAHQEHRQFLVMTLGLKAADVERLKGIFQQAPQGGRRYAIASPSAMNRIDILLVDYDNPSALHEKNAILKSCPNTPIVAVSRGPLNGAPRYHIRGMLVAARVLGVLARIPLEAPSGPATTGEAGQDRAEFQTWVKPKAIPAAVTAPERLPGYRALVVDDSAAIQKSLESNLIALEKVSAVDFADSGEEALERAETTKYDLIFLDVMMPGIDGYETCSRLRKIAGYKKTPIIMVSGKTSPLDEVKGIMAGCTTYLTKPVQQDAFQQLGRRVLAWLENYKPDKNQSH